MWVCSIFRVAARSPLITACRSDHVAHPVKTIVTATRAIAFELVCVLRIAAPYDLSGMVVRRFESGTQALACREPGYRYCTHRTLGTPY
jgi:hypothetical protein